jgi:hypothetical protein
MSQPSGPNDTPLCLASHNELINELMSRGTLAAVLIFVDREMTTQGPTKGDQVNMLRSPGWSNEGVLKLLEQATEYWRGVVRKQ